MQHETIDKHPIFVMQSAVRYANLLNSFMDIPINISVALQAAGDHWRNQVATAERVYGKHAALRMKLDRAVLAQSQRLPGGPSSSFAGLDAILGRDTQIDFTDVLNRKFVLGALSATSQLK